MTTSWKDRETLPVRGGRGRVLRRPRLASERPIRSYDSDQATPPELRDPPRKVSGHLRAAPSACASPSGAGAGAGSAHAVKAVHRHLFCGQRLLRGLCSQSRLLRKPIERCSEENGLLAHSNTELNCWGSKWQPMTPRINERPALSKGGCPRHHVLWPELLPRGMEGEEGFPGSCAVPRTA